MKKQDIKVGKTYVTKVSGVVVPVKLFAEHANGGWMGTNLNTRRVIRIKTAARLRREV